MLKFFIRIFFLFCLLSNTIFAMELGEKQVSLFDQLPDELIVYIIYKLSLIVSSPLESLKILDTTRLINRRFNILVQEKSVIENLVLYWSKELNIPKAHLILNWHNAKYKKPFAKPGPWFKKILLEMLDNLCIEDLEQVNDNGKNVLMLAYLEDNEEIVDFLLEKNMNLNAQDDNKNPVITYALSADKPKSVKNLLRKNVNVENCGKTLLEYAATQNDAELFDLLKNKGVDDKSVKYEEIWNPLIVIKHAKMDEKCDYLCFCAGAALCCCIVSGIIVVTFYFILSDV